MNDKSRTRRRNRTCNNCGGHYQAVVRDVDGETRRECGCLVRVVPTRVEDVQDSTNIEADLCEIRSDEEVDA